MLLKRLLRRSVDALVQLLQLVEDLLRHAGAEALEVPVRVGDVFLPQLRVGGERLAHILDRGVQAGQVQVFGAGGVAHHRLVGAHLAVDALGHVLDRWGQATAAAGQAGLGAFLYLEVLDASFSFDGVIGAFALTQNLFLIAIGLGIGAMYVRSMTVMLVERGTLAEFRYLEHGAFWSILILSVVMFAQSMWHIPEVVTGLGGAFVIGLSLLSSLRWNRRNAA